MSFNEIANRRRFLKMMGVLSSIGVSTVSTGATATQEGPVESTTIELGGEISGWQGRAPQSIDGKTNPTLRLEAGTTYEIVWENLDIAPHNVVIENEGGDKLVESDIITSETQTVEFTAEEGMSVYYCAVHPSSMRGDVEIVGGGQETETSEPADETTVETVVEIPGERVPENLAFDDEGAMYFGITAGEVWKLTPEQTQETGLTLDDVQQMGTLPGGAIGVEVGPDETVYVASQSEQGTGVWQVPQNGEDPSLFATIPTVDGEEDVFPNDILYDGDRDRLLVTESFGGVVYEVPLDADDPENAASEWIATDLIDTESFGANGLTFGPDGRVVAAVTRATNDAGEDVGRLVRVPVVDDGSAGDAETYLESTAIFGADGVTARESDLYVAANALNEVVRVTSDQETETVASGENGLVFPSDVLFGTTQAQQDTLFICNFANENPEEGAILRTQP
jgi:plastocyanin/sugar lactone lactonase YvrE